MDAAFLRSGPKVRILLGKGGVGKSVVASALSRRLADEGARTLLIELDGRPDIGHHFGLSESLPQRDTVLYQSHTGGCVLGRHVAPDDALVGYLNDHSLGILSRQLHRSGLIDLIAGSIPGLRDVLVLAKIKQYAKRDDLDAIVVDGPSTGHALTLLTSPAGLARIARTGPVKEQAEEVAELLKDAQRCGVVLITTPEELPVTETIEAAYRIEDEADVALEFIVANRVHEPFDHAVLDLLDEREHDDALRARLQETLDYYQAAEHSEEPELHRLQGELALPLYVLPAMEGVRAASTLVAELAAQFAAPRVPGARS